MTEANSSSNPALLQSYVDKMANAQNSIQDLQREIAKLRQDARADGFNMEAVYELGLIRSKSPHDGGVELLTTVLDYARKTGIEVASNLSDRIPTPSIQDKDGRRKTPEVSHFKATQRFLDQRFSLFAHVCLGIFISVGFIWLLH